MNSSSNNDDANNVQYVWDKYVSLIFAILMGIFVVIWGIPDLIKHGIRSKPLFFTLQLSACSLFLTSQWLDEIDRKKLGKVLEITGLIALLGAFITRYVFEGKIF